MTAPELPAHLSIGDVAEETGITPETLRVWERRYGKPVPVRLPSGHRRYTGTQVAWLRNVSEALARGLRAGSVLRMQPDTLRTELEALAESAPAGTDSDPLLEDLRAFRGNAIKEYLLAAAGSSTPLAYVEEVMAPITTRIGRAWAEGEIAVRHEHFFTAVASDVLRSLAAACPCAEACPRIVLANLEGEWHVLGLQMALYVAAARGFSPYLLGASTPDDDLVRASVDLGAAALGVSVSLATGGVETDRRLAAVREALPDDVELVVGGEGARRGRRGPRGVRYVDGLSGWDAYLAELADTA